MMQRGLERYLSLVAALCSAVLNVLVALRLLAFKRSLGWELESEWEGRADTWRVDSAKIIWGLFFAYFASAAGACCVGVAGLLKNKASLIRFYRDVSIADFVFITLSTLYLSYTSFSRYVIRASLCEELSRHPELMRDMSEMGLSLENCEMWFQRALLVVMGVMFVLIVVRLQMVILVNKFYRHLTRTGAAGKSHIALREHAPLPDEALHRIYLLPTPTTPSFPPYNFNAPHARAPSQGDVVVYAPVPVGISEQEARKMNATEAWIASPAPHGHRHSHSHAHAHSRSQSVRSHSRGHRHSRSAASPPRPEREGESEKELISLV